VNLRGDKLRNLLNNPWNHSTVQLKSRQPNPLTEFQRQYDAELGLKVVSQPLDIPLDDLLSYDYVTQAGEGITIYVIDSGANLEHPVSIYF
jgi:hypothetical protein